MRGWLFLRGIMGPVFYGLFISRDAFVQTQQQPKRDLTGSCWSMLCRCCLVCVCVALRLTLVRLWCWCVHLWTPNPQYKLLPVWNGKTERA